MNSGHHAQQPADLPASPTVTWGTLSGVGHAEATPLRPEDVEGLAAFIQVRTLAAGEPLVRAGDAPTAVYIVRDGLLELAVRGPRGRLVIQTLRPGDIDGDIQLLLDRPMPYETRANTASTCLVIDRDAFERLLATHPQLSRRWLTSVSQRLARSHSRLTSLLGEPLETQVAQLLLEERVGDVVNLPQTTVAALLGVRRPSVNRVLRRFRPRRHRGPQVRQSADPRLVRVGPCDHAELTEVERVAMVAASEMPALEMGGGGVHHSASRGGMARDPVRVARTVSCAFRLGAA